MESKDLLHPENGENQNLEVNPGASTEAQSNTENEQAPNGDNGTTPEEIADSAVIPEFTPVESEMEVAITPEKTETEIIPESSSQDSDTATPEKPQKIAQASVEEMFSEVANAETSQNQSEIEDEDTDEKNEENIEEIEKEYASLTLEELVNTLNTVVANTDVVKIKHRVGILKAKIIDHIKQIKKEQLAAFTANNETGEEYVQEPLEIEGVFNTAMNIYKTNKAKFIEDVEAEKQKNLEVKQAIIEGLRNLIETESNLKTLNDKFKEFQEEWKNIGPVPQNESTNLWQNYHFYVEKFFDILKINKELRVLDLKKNLEQKIKLCESAEELLLQESINKSFKELQKLHDDWKEIGPVPEDKKEEIWERFKNASDQINQRRREYYDAVLTEQQNNYNAKVVLCEQAEDLIGKETTSVKESNAIGEQLTELLKVWKTLGPAPSKLNDEIWTRFKTALDKFFQTKKEYFQQIKEEQLQNYNLKLNLAIRAEAISARTDWKQATEEIIELQKEWKNIGAVAKKHSEAIWKRFRTACDKFFEAKSFYFSNIQTIEADNLAKKEELIQRIINHEFTDDKEENLESMKAYQREWTEIGHVPKKDKDRIYAEYRDAINKRFADLKMSVDDVKRGNFKNKIDTILNNPNADKILDKEKRFLVNKLNQLKDDISLWENNLGFFANSKNADLLKAEFSKKIESAKAEVKELEYKIKMMSSSK